MASNNQPPGPSPSQEERLAWDNIVNSFAVKRNVYISMYHGQTEKPSSFWDGVGWDGVGTFSPTNQAGGQQEQQPTYRQLGNLNYVHLPGLPSLFCQRFS